MIMGMEVALALVGLYLLVMGKSWGKDSISHWQFRLLGAFLLAVFPVMIAIGMVIGIVWALQHPGASTEQLKEGIKWPAMGAEFLTVIVWTLIGFFWEKSIKRKAQAALSAPAGPAPSPLAASPRPTGY
jgi:Zn-dependent protease with chaperone function